MSNIDCLSTPFIIYPEEIIKEAYKGVEEGIKYRRQSNSQHTDDQAILAEIEKYLQYLMKHVEEACRKPGMKINTKKTKVIKVKRRKRTRKIKK